MSFKACLLLLLAGAVLTPRSAAAGVVAALVPAAAVGATPADEAKDPEQAYLDALKDRKLFRLLEAYCTRQLARADLRESERARYTVELANGLAEQAQQERDATQRARLWERASAIVHAFLDAHPEHAQAPFLRFQLGVFRLAQGELLRQQARVSPADRAAADAARGELEAAAATLRDVDRQITALARESKRDGGAGMTPEQLAALANRSRFCLGQALWGLAQSHPRHSAGQTDFASQAAAQFEPFTQRYASSDIVLESYLARADCLRLLDDPAGALKLVREIERHDTPDRFRDRAIALRAQVLLDQRKPAAARDLIEDVRKLLASPNAELDLIYVQATLALARERSAAKDHLTVRQLVEDAVRSMDVIEQTHGAYWATRCALMLGELAADNVLVEDPAVLVRMADGQYRRNDRSGTVATLDRALRLAEERGDADSAMTVGLRAASVVAELGKMDDAAERFARLAATYANLPKAAEAQFMVASCLGQAYGRDRTPERLAQYQQALEQHLRLFPQHDTASEARWLLGALRLSQRRWPEAIALLQEIGTGHKRFPAARREAARAYESWLGELWARNQDASRVLAAALEYLEKALPAGGGESLAAADVPIALARARILVHPTVAHYEEAEGMLENVLFGQAAEPAERGEARRLNLIALLGQDKFDEAGRMLDTEFVGIPQELFAVVRELEEAATRTSDARRRQIGQLELQATNRLVDEAGALTSEQELQAQIYLALAHANAGQANRAQELFAKLRDRVPSNARLIEAEAGCMMQLGRYGDARELWRTLLGMVPENSPVWFRAKYSLALACFRSNDRPQCLKIVRVTRLLHPDLGGPDLRAKFDDLEAKCQAAADSGG